MGKPNVKKSGGTNKRIDNDTKRNSKQQTPEKADEHPEWLPNGWDIEVRTRQSGPAMGSAYKCYIDPSNTYKFYSKPEVLRHLETIKDRKCSSNKKKGTSKHSPSKEEGEHTKSKQHSPSKEEEKKTKSNQHSPSKEEEKCINMHSPNKGEEKHISMHSPSKDGEKCTNMHSPSIVCTSIPFLSLPFFFCLLSMNITIKFKDPFLSLFITLFYDITIISLELCLARSQYHPRILWRLFCLLYLL